MAAIASTVVAQMWDGDYHMSSGWWWVMGIGWLILLAVVILLGVLLMRTFSNSRSTPNAGNILDERFARGEIDEDEYHRRRRALRG